LLTQIEEQPDQVLRIRLQDLGDLLFDGALASALS